MHKSESERVQGCLLRSGRWGKGESSLFLSGITWEGSALLSDTFRQRLSGHLHRQPYMISVIGSVLVGRPGIIAIPGLCIVPYICVNPESDQLQ